MTKFKVDSTVGNGNGNGAAAPQAAPQTTPEAATAKIEAAKVEGSSKNDEMVANIATIGVIGVGAAIIEAALIPGIIVGVAAAFAPKYLPQLGRGLKPLFKSTVQGTYKFGQKAREAVAEARERVSDLVAEVNAERAAAPAAAAAAPAAAAEATVAAHS
jgi:hypothetical protein